jgi:hypothetical protein
MLAFHRPCSSSFDLHWNGFIVSYMSRSLSEVPVLSLEQAETQWGFLTSERYSLIRVAHSAQSRILLLYVKSV